MGPISGSKMVVTSENEKSEKAMQTFYISSRYDTFREKCTASFYVFEIRSKETNCAWQISTRALLFK